MNDEGDSHNPIRSRKPSPPDDWPERFLAAYGKNGNITRSARQAKVTRQAVQARREASPEFAVAMKAAQEEAIDLLEEEARRRAVDGVLEPVFYLGKKVGSVRKYSDTLLTVLLKGNKPEKYRENVTVAGDPDQPFVIKTIKGVSVDDLK